MTERKLKYAVGLFLIGSHAGLLLAVMALYLLAGFSVEEFTTLVAIIAPVFAGYTTSILAFIIRDARVRVDASRPVTPVYAGLSFAAPGVLVTVFGVAIVLKAFNVSFADFEDFKRFLMLTESVFAAYAGMFVYSLFDRQPPVGVPKRP